ncbi:uncharacterized protein F4807DRAFT_471219 [Annulohypoxylon truncatum]|uniref:uncharacterized protein n=1 Tax=Annulohypoxylon truncatum TaxID=327061 RepID=UPI0020080179|nr:uncharacterized protein F4807DRAFT_471219 [Annulohypoxylon truncatum]KAI1205213.1 hypothetical protein F4807DRAFT_471219 [Annulohypoxylon truncatum]
MAEAQQEQPQAHQPQPEPVFAAAEEPAHALPHQSPAQSPLSQATQEQEKRQGTQGQVQVQVRVEPKVQFPSQAKPDVKTFHTHARAPTTNLRSPNNATTTTLVAYAQEQECAREQNQDREQDQKQRQQIPSSNHANDDVDNPISISTSTSTSNSNSDSNSTSTTASPLRVPTTTTVAADQASLPSATAATNGASPDHRHQGQEQQGGVAPSSEAMSNNPPHHHQGHRQPASYPTPTAYATPGMTSAHYGYANPAAQGPDAYRASAGVPNSAMALPSMRTFDPAQQQAQQQQHMAMAMPVNPVPSVPSMPAQQHMSYFGQQPVPMAANNPYALPPDALRPQYALPPSGPGSVLGGRHKKCDEQHPVCKNCQKSKRECLGYDPIFKNQQQQHPTNIRPAPNSSTSTSAPSSRPPVSSSTSASASASVPGGAAQAQSSYSTTLPPVIPNNTTPTTAPFTGNLTAAGTAASTIKGEPLEYPSAIDPTLEPALATTSTSTSHFLATRPIIPNPLDYYSPDTPRLIRGGGGPTFVPLNSSVSHPTSYSSQQQQTSAYTSFPARKMKVHELVGMSGAIPPALDSPLTSEKLAEVRDLYDQVYAPGLEKFFETEWYTRPRGVDTLISNAAVNEMLAGFLQSVAKTDANNVAGMQYSANLEFRVVWDLASLVYASEYKVNMGEQLPPPDDGSEARNRVTVFEVLLSGDYLEQNPLQPPPPNSDIRLHRIREFKFWYFLAEFLRVKDQPGLDTMRQRDYILGQLRELLDGRENRDVLYSLAVIRALAPNLPPDFESSLPPHLDESDPKNKLAVARKFIQDESQVTGGTTNVVRRFSELAVRAFIVPGSNIVRR